jgi:hypothetical protein
MHLIQFLLISTISLLLVNFPLEAIQTQIITWDKTEASILLQPHEAYSKATFRTYNHGDAPVRINHAYSESNAIKTLVKKRVIESGESATVEVSFFSEGKDAGVYHNKVNVFFEGHKDPLATLHLVVTIPELIKCSPNVITWEYDNCNDTFMVDLMLNENFITNLNSIDYDQRLYNVSLIPDKLSAYNYTLKITPIAENRPFNSLIKIKASGPQLTEIEEPIFLFNSYSLSK